MFVEFEDPESIFYEMMDSWNKLQDAGINPMGLTHHELAKRTQYSGQEWKEFITDPAVVDAMNEEFRMLQRAKLQTLVTSLEADTKSTGVAQVITALNNNLNKEMEKKASGPAIIYTFVPLNEQEMMSPNVRILDHNPFEVK